MATEKQVIEAFNNLVHKSKHAGHRKAKTGKKDTSTGLIIPSLDTVPYPSQIWVRLEQDGEPLPAYNIGKVSSNTVDLWVWVGEDKDGNLSVISPVDANASQGFGSTASNAYQPDLVLSNQTIVDRRSIAMLRARKSGTGAYDVIVPSYVGMTIGTFEGEVISLSTYVPTTSNKSKWVVVSLDTSVNTLSVSEGAETNYVSYLTDGYKSITIGNDDIPLCAVLLVEGETSISESDIIDIREFINSPTSAGGSGGITTIQSDGSNVSTNRTKINIIESTNIKATVADNSGDDRTDLTLSTTDLVMQKDTISGDETIPSGYTVIHGKINVTGTLDVSGKLKMV